MAGPADWRSRAGGGTPACAEGGCGRRRVTQQSRVRVGARVLLEGRGLDGGRMAWRGGGGRLVVGFRGSWGGLFLRCFFRTWALV